MTTRKPKPSDAIGGGKPGPGRPKGIPNKQTTAIKDMIIAALDKKGGVEYLVEQADANPIAFMALIGKVLPLQITGGGGDAIQVVITRLADDHNNASK